MGRRVRASLALATIFAVGLSIAGGAQSPPPAALGNARVDVQVPIAPTPFAGGARTHLAYELHITNLHLGDARLEKIEVLGDTGAVATCEGTALNQLLTWPGDPAVRDGRTLGRWQRAIAWIWLALEPGTVPRTLRHRLTIDGRTTELEPLAVAATPPVVIAPPLRGGVWIAINGPGRDSAHRLGMMVSRGRLHIPQRFAIDWVLAAEDGRVVTGDPADNKSHPAYGQAVRAVADAVVTAAVDGIPDNSPGAPPAVAVTDDTVAGNYVVLDLGKERYAFYARLQPGSLQVKTGDRVRGGQMLGRLGNSGDSVSPHLHFHVMNGPNPLQAEGVPFLISSFEALAGLTPGRRTDASPMQNARVRFER